MNALADIVHDEILSMMICMADNITAMVSSYQQFFFNYCNLIYSCGMYLVYDHGNVHSMYWPQQLNWTC